MKQNEQDKIWDHYQNKDPSSFDLSRPRLKFLSKKCWSQSTVLNIGVGSGYLEKLLIAKGALVYSIDPSASTIAKIKHDLAMFERANIGYSKEIPYKDNFFDFVIMSEVLEHLEDQDLEPTLHEVRRVLKPDGKFIGTVFHLMKILKQVK